MSEDWLVEVVFGLGWPIFILVITGVLVLMYKDRER